LVQRPARFFQFLDVIRTVRGGYYNHRWNWNIHNTVNAEPSDRNGFGRIGRLATGRTKGIATPRHGAVLLGGITFSADENQQRIGDVVV